RAVGVDPQRILADARTIAEAGAAVVTGAGVDLRKAVAHRRSAWKTCLTGSIQRACQLDGEHVDQCADTDIKRGGLEERQIPLPQVGEPAAEVARQRHAVAEPV